MRLSYLLSVWNVVCVVGKVHEMEELVEFMWMCITRDHNDVCKKKEHGRKLGVESRNWIFMEYYQWTNLWTSTKIFVPLKSTIEFVSNFSQS